MTQASIGPASSGDATVIQGGVEAGSRAGVGLAEGKRLHGGKDQGQAVSHFLIGGTGQSWGVACRE